MMTFCRVIAAALLLTVLPAAAQYRWIDAQDQVNYGDFPPPGARSITKVETRTRATGEDSGDLPFELQRAIAQLPATLYTADGCPPCEPARVFLRRRGVPFQEIVVETDVDAQELKRRTGTTSVPVLALGSTPHIGYNETAWTAALDAAGYPAQSVLPANYRAAAPQPISPRTVNAAARRPTPAPR
jgi:glutaredoxin